MPAVPDRRVGLGCMRLSTAPDRDETRAIAVLHAALDAGVTFLDTADAYCWNDTGTGHNERLIAQALASWPGDRKRILVATKGGLTRPEGRWVANGRARHLAEACAASRRALGVERIALYQLHAPDRRTPFSTSVRALDALKRAGEIEAIGLCNVNLRQLQEAQQITTIAAVQVELNPWHEDEIASGVVGYCVENGIRLIAYRPLGGTKRRRAIESDPVLANIAARHGATPHEIVLAWLCDLADVIVPVPGPSRRETAVSAANAQRIQLAAVDRAELDERFSAGARVRGGGGPASVSLAAPQRDGEIVLVMGLPAAGKSTIAGGFVERGYARINRDLTGGSLRALVPVLDGLMAAGSSRVVLDNTYVSRKSRAPVIEAATRHRLPVRGVWLDTSVDEAQVNACWRMLKKYGRLLEPEEIRQAAKHDPGTIGPGVHYRHQDDLEPPDLSEGFSTIDVVRFERAVEPGFTNRAVIVWCDGVLHRNRSGEVLVERADVLRRYQGEGWQLCGLAWHPEIATGAMTKDAVEAELARMTELLGLDLEMSYCPHPAGPPVCWCRKPLPGLGVALIDRHRLDATQCIYVGSGSQDPLFARRLGFRYQSPDEFFGTTASG